MDPIFSVAHAEAEIKLFIGSSNASLEVVEGGAHYLSATDPIPVNKSLLALVTL